MHGLGRAARIAAVALAEKDLRYAGTLTVVDGLNLPHQLADPRIQAQVETQITKADLLVVSKTSPKDDAITKMLTGLGSRHWVGTDDLLSVAAMVFEATSDMDVPNTDHAAHPGYVQWCDMTPSPLTKNALLARLSDRPDGLLRVKGLLPNPAGGYWEIHAVGLQTEIIARNGTSPFAVVAIGLSEALTTSEIEAWWTTDHTVSPSTKSQNQRAAPDETAP